MIVILLRKLLSPFSENNICLFHLLIYHVLTYIKIDRYQMIKNKCYFNEMCME